ncbi:MAG: hypothetical protein RBT11_09420 [Desulfobacterales bacterium]|nr:hypothetical protein [Desulfobacterales bacterium]
MITNDSVNPKHTLIVTGQIDKLYALSPKRLRLVGTIGTQIKQALRLDTQEKYPLKLIAVRAKQGKHIQYRFEEVENQKNSTYQITVENTKKEVGSYLDTLYLVTDSKIRPEIEVPVYGLIQPDTDKRKE